MQKDLALQEERRDLMMETATNPDVAATVYAVVQELMATSFEGVGCTYGSPPTDAATFPCVTVVPMDGDPVEKRYLDGSYVANHRFALLLRTKAENDQARLDARSMIDRLAASLEAVSYTHLAEFHQTTKEFSDFFSLALLTMAPNERNLSLGDSNANASKRSRVGCFARWRACHLEHAVRMDRFPVRARRDIP